MWTNRAILPIHLYRTYLISCKKPWSVGLCGSGVCGKDQLYLVPQGTIILICILYTMSVFFCRQNPPLCVIITRVLWPPISIYRSCLFFCGVFQVFLCMKIAWSALTGSPSEMRHQTIQCSSKLLSFSIGSKMPHFLFMIRLVREGRGLLYIFVLKKMGNFLKTLLVRKYGYYLRFNQIVR